MKTIGIIGGMSWESTQLYYQQINQLIKLELGGLHSAKLVLFSVDFAEIAALQRQGDWHQAGAILADAAKALERAGADFIVIATNTMHKVADQVMANINLPLLHIADATAKQLQQVSITKIGLLGTAFTMEQSFYKGRLVERFGIDVITPNKVQREMIHKVIFEQLCLGQFSAQAKADFLAVMADLREQGAEGIILGCTEIALLVNQSDIELPLFDTTAIHCQAIVELALLA
ncbi:MULTISPECIES: aspartate/glutamate racemase family protein [unclassified Motilimonas]|uniref:aspartate/glutamate racemase family protein n=1 Tax=Motilimonas TaxID=1914248 RepID=UPI001E5EF232|nr:MULTISPECIES: aspartate/glutamate racemase family protein [unclassified Motilimonas]MCE0559242.1 aspartate/glutamate racemase family protein [Motilimonas sp. E26]MDO6527467.1 aspartate/glutamate racemase family protein [Motilimonas sp. 1_MG-2023]